MPHYIFWLWPAADIPVELYLPLTGVPVDVIMLLHLDFVLDVTVVVLLDLVHEVLIELHSYSGHGLVETKAKNEELL